MFKDLLVSPVLKWAGGKRQLLEALTPLLPEHIDSYCEPFVGGGAVLFHIQPAKASINDVNAELISVYKVIRDDVDGLVECLKTLKNDQETFYRIRNLDRDRKSYAALGPAEKAARIIYLNKTCFNGLFRVNSAGEFNTPYGRYRNPNIVNEETLRAVSRYFNAASIKITHGDYGAVLEKVTPKTFVYLDPPYDPLSNSASFTSYTRIGFGREEQVRLRDWCVELDRRGCRFMLSNSATDFIRDLYQDFNVSIVRAKRAINSVAARRGQVDEVLVRNYE